MRLSSAVYVVLSILSLGGCAKNDIRTPGIFLTDSQVPPHSQGVAQKLMDKAIGVALTTIDLKAASGKVCFVEVNSDVAFGVENVRHAIIAALRQAGAKGLSYNTADADVLVAVNPSVYSFQYDVTDYGMWMFGFAHITERQTASCKMNVAIVDLKTREYAGPATSGEAYSSFLREYSERFWIDSDPIQGVTTDRGSALEQFSQSK